ncbi:MAG: aminodeoxychorismate/anthranilate synthase component II [Clostridiales bacterium]|nr:aminodeoxychorismate/anthranilate synthase component II [Clostridiales bacterium]
MILLVDNYDSFSYNLYQMIGSIDPDIKVIRNDEMTVEEIEELNPSRIVLSPGPGRPENAGIMLELIDKLKGKFPILGVCLGHQAISMAFGATVTYAPRLMHGKQSEIKVDTTDKLFRNLPQKFKVARYHSLIVDPKTIPDSLVVTAVTEEGEVMAVTAKDYPVYGVQFHPESIMTPQGLKILRNFIER